MKARTTIKNIREMFGLDERISIGFCGAQYMLYYENPFAYTCGVNGWNFDAYNINGTCICTGNGAMPKGMEYPYETLREYELKAEKVVNSIDIPYKEKPCMVKKILNDFIDEVKGGSK